MTHTPELTFEEIEAGVLHKSNEREVRMLEALKERDMDNYRDAVTQLYAQQFMRIKLANVFTKAKGAGRKKDGAHSQGRHK